MSGKSPEFYTMTCAEYIRYSSLRHVRSLGFSVAANAALLPPPLAVLPSPLPTCRSSLRYAEHVVERRLRKIPRLQHNAICNSLERISTVVDLEDMAGLLCCSSCSTT